MKQKGVCSIEEEVWRDIPDYEGLYQASNLGRIRSLDRIDRLGRFKSGKVLKPSFNHNGYNIITLCGKTFRLNRLIYSVFKGDIPEGYEVNHIDENKENNSVSNLNLMTPKENTNWGTGIERQIMKRVNGKKSKPVLQYDLEGNFIKKYPSISEAQRITGVFKANIIKCCKGKQNKTGGYKWRYEK